MKKHVRILLITATLLLAVVFGVQVCAADLQEIAIQPIYEQYVNPVYQQFAGEVSFVSPTYDAEALTYHSSIEAAAEELRGKLEEREATITIGLTTKQHPNDFPFLSTIFEAALDHTGNPTQGDYLRWQYMQYSGALKGKVNSQTGIFTLELTYSVVYYTSHEQEMIVDDQVQKLLDQLNVYGADDYQKICAIYDYICETVMYDNAGLAAQNSMLIYTAYAALINKTAVCQGYANLFYRLALELGVDCRVITGQGNGGPHAWNIVKLDGKYYNLDATWDAVYKQLNRDYQFFLRCDSDFGDHQRSEEYQGADFYMQYPMGDRNYDYSCREFIPGEFDGKPGVTDADAVFLLRNSLFPNSFLVDPAVDKDLNSDGLFSDADAVYLLRFTLFPDAYPLYPGK